MIGRILNIRRCSLPPFSMVLIGFVAMIDLAGLPAKEDLDGQNLVPLMKNPEIDWERLALMTHGKGNHSLQLYR